MARDQIQLMPERNSSEPPHRSGDGFGSEFRELAQQRRFRRKDGVRRTEAAQEPVEASPARVTHEPDPPAPTPRPTYVQRLSQDPTAALMELSRMADRVIEARDVAAAERGRADRAERDLRAVEQRLMAARGLVHEAQRTAQRAAERCAWVEGRCEALESALELAMHASWLQRWRWRREERRQSPSVPDDARP